MMNFSEGKILRVPMAREGAKSWGHEAFAGGKSIMSPESARD
jgi:hypothetical protein